MVNGKLCGFCPDFLIANIKFKPIKPILFYNIEES